VVLFPRGSQGCWLARGQTLTPPDRLSCGRFAPLNAAGQSGHAVQALNAPLETTCRKGLHGIARADPFARNPVLLGPLVGEGLTEAFVAQVGGGGRHTHRLKPGHYPTSASACWSDKVNAVSQIWHSWNIGFLPLSFIVGIQ
jgi:hypothetical protein